MTNTIRLLSLSTFVQVHCFDISFRNVCCCHSCSTNRAEHTDVVGGSRVEHGFKDHFLLISQSVVFSAAQ